MLSWSGDILFDGKTNMPDVELLPILTTGDGPSSDLAYGDGARMCGSHAIVLHLSSQQAGTNDEERNS